MNSKLAICPAAVTASGSYAPALRSSNRRTHEGTSVSAGATETRKGLPASATESLSKAAWDTEGARGW